MSPVAVVLGLGTAAFFALRALGGSGSSSPENIDKKFTALPVPKDPAMAIWKGKQYMAGLRSISSNGPMVSPDVAVLATAQANGGPLVIDDIIDTRPGYTGDKPKAEDWFTAIPAALVEVPDSGGVKV